MVTSRRCARAAQRRWPTFAAALAHTAHAQRPHEPVSHVLVPAPTPPSLATLCKQMLVSIDTCPPSPVHARRACAPRPLRTGSPPGLPVRAPLWRPARGPRARVVAGLRTADADGERQARVRLAVHGQRHGLELRQVVLFVLVLLLVLRTLSSAVCARAPPGRQLPEPKLLHVACARRAPRAEPAERRTRGRSS